MRWVNIINNKFLIIKTLGGIIAIGVLIIRNEIVTALAIIAISGMIEALEHERRKRANKD